jgi:formate dehydrogenase iron-sulfur subunit
VVACKQSHELAYDTPRSWQKNDGLSARNWTSILRRDGNHFIRKQCRHCLEPACASACPVGALHTTTSGAVVYDSKKCLGCRYCMMACPYGIPRYDWDEPVPYVRKCILCYEQIDKGGLPACTSACPTQATIFGDRKALIAEGHRRITDNSDKYIDHVWGEHEYGGTSVLYVSDINLDFLTYGSGNDRRPLPQTTAAAMKSVPFAFIGMGGVMYGLNWIIRRRMQLAEPSEGED